MILESKRCFLKTAAAKELLLAIQTPKQLVKNLGIKAADGWPTEALLSGAEYVIEGLEMEGAESVRSGSPWWLWWIIQKPSESSETVGQLIGHVGLKGSPTSSGSVEITYSVAATSQNRGLGTEALKALIAWSFQQQKVKRILAETTLDNIASQRVLEKAGFVKNIRQNSGGDVFYELVKVG